VTLHRHIFSPEVRWAFAVSLLIHGLVLWTGRDWFVRSGAASPAVLQVVVGPAATGLGPTEVLPVPRPERALLPRVVPARKAESGLKTTPERISPMEPRPEPASVPATGSAAISAPTSASVASTAVPGSASASSVVTPSTGVDLDGLRQYRVALGVQAARFKRYPPRARESGWEGRVRLRLDVSESGAVLNVSLLRSSGHVLLDEAAVEMLHQAATRTVVPETLRGRAFVVDSAVDYSLSEESGGR
jgi:periplasmic protein TonB